VTKSAPRMGSADRSSALTRPKRSKRPSAKQATPSPGRGAWARVVSLIQQWMHRRYGKRTKHRYRRDRRPLAVQLPVVVVGLLLVWWLISALHQGSDVISRGQDAIKHVLPHQSAPLRTTPISTAPLQVAGKPSLDVTRVNDILDAYNSPLKGQGKAIIALSTRYKVDDAIALAFFVMESRAGTQGEAVVTRSFGNLRPMPNAPAVDGYRQYDSWLEGATEWFQVMRALYLDTMKLDTVEEIVPVYAPATDNNQPPVMIAGIHQLVTCWRGNADACPESPHAVRDMVDSGGN
jgi:hypothetical protein